ncbi:MAG: 2-oxoacid:acceptor oxidoreductase subunit alpha [Candidatus Baldrarchaeota archaeon]
MTNRKGKIDFLQGNDAIVEGAILAGCRFFAGYPITPSSEIMESMAARLPLIGGVFVQMEDELGSIAAAIGASLTGVKAMTATSGPGFSLMQENIGLAIMCEVPVVIVNVMRGGPSTGLPTKASQADIMQARWGHHGDGEIIALAPWSVQECLDLTIKAFNLAEEYRTPVIVLSDAILAHLREVVRVPDPEEIVIVERKRPEVPPEEFLPFKANESLVPPMATLGKGYKIHYTGLSHDERGYPTDDPENYKKLIERITAKIRNNVEKIASWDMKYIEDAEMILISYGSSARAVLQACINARKQGHKVGFLRLITIWPFTEELIKKISENVSKILVLEQNTGQVLHLVKEAIGNRAKIYFYSKLGGEPFTPHEILEQIRRILK